MKSVKRKHPMFGRKKPRYYVIKKAVQPSANDPGFAGHAYWEPKPCDVEKYGVERKSLGHHSFGAMALADQQNQKLDALKMRSDAPRREPNPYMRGSFGKFYWKWSHRPAFYKLSAKSQEEWDTAWKRIGPELGHLQLRAVSPSDVEAFADKLDKETTEWVRWRTLNKLREIFNAACSYPDLLPSGSPCKTIENPQPDGRKQLWMPHEIRLLIAKAEELNRPNMALTLRLMYQAALSPIDAHTVTVEMIIKDAGGWHLRRERMKVEGRKNKRPGIEASIPTDLAEALLKHASPNGTTAHPKAQILMRDRTGKPYISTSDFSSDFMEIRTAALPDEAKKPRDQQRLAIDFRRTRNTYAKIGGASKEDRAKLLANSIDTNDRLHATYTPSTVVTTRQVAAQAEAGAIALEEALKGQDKAG